MLDAWKQESLERYRGDECSLTISAPALRWHVSHAPIQLSLVRTHDRIEVEINFAVLGGPGKPDQQP